MTNPKFDLEPLEPRWLLSAAVSSAVTTALNDIEPWVQQAKLTAPDGSADDNFGSAVAIDGNTMVVGSTGAAYVFTQTDSNWTEVAELTDTTGTTDSSFGAAVAISGQTIVVGGSGAAYIYTEPGTGWVDMTQTATLTASNGKPDDQFGDAVAINGNTVVVGAEGTKVTSVLTQDQIDKLTLGAAYVFSEPATGWSNMTQTAKLTPSDGKSEDNFGASVAINGNTVVVGATQLCAGAYGEAYVFSEPASGWGDTTQTAKLLPSAGSVVGYGLFGCSVAIDGNTVVVGADGNYEYLGAAFVYTEPGNGWTDTTQTAELTPGNGACGYDIFYGCSVGISGNTVVIGAMGADNWQGNAYVYTQPASGWVSTDQATSTLAASDTDIYFGGAVAISGNTLVAARTGDSSPGAYVFSPATFQTPTVTGMSCTSGTVTGGTTVTITGTGLNDIGKVFFGNVAAGSFTILSSTQISVVSPEGVATGMVDVTVTAVDSAASLTSATSSADQFTYTSVPVATVTGLGNTSGLQSGGTAITITGTGFTGATTVFFGNVAASRFTVLSDTQISAILPAQPAPGVVDVTVANPCGVSAISAADQFTVLPAPILTSLSCTSGSSTGGTTVILTGSDLSSVTTVIFGNEEASSFTILSDTQISAVTPEGYVGKYVYVSVVGDGNHQSALTGACFFTYTAPPVPTVTGLSATSGLATGGTTLIITGTGFTGASQVLFGWQPASSFTVLSDTQISAVTPAESAFWAGSTNSTVDVTVRNNRSGSSATSSADQFTYTPPPAAIVTGIDTPCGPTTGNTTVIITGTGMTGATEVYFGDGAASSFTILSDTQISAVAPAESAGTVDITISSFGNVSAISPADQYTYVAVAAPTVSGIDTTSGPAAGNTTVTITGTGFTGATSVLFGNVAATSFTVLSDTQISAVSPAEWAGTVDITVKNAGGVSPICPADAFTFAAVAAAPNQWVQQTQLIAPRSVDYCFGESVAVDGNTMVVGSGGGVYLYTQNGSVWTEVARLTASAGATGWDFGDAVAISGNTVVVGSNGAAYVYSEPATGWADMTQTAMLNADCAGYGWFGEWVAVSGNTVVVGASRLANGTTAFVYTEPTTGWTDMTQTARFSVSGDQAADFYCASVAISGDNVVVGGGGMAYVYAEPAAGWTDMTQTATLTVTNEQPDDYGFGGSVAISDNTIVVGDSFTTVDGNPYQGAAYVYAKPTSGWTDMTQTATLTASDGAINNYFGGVVAISGNTVVVVGTQTESTPVLYNSMCRAINVHSSVYLFTASDGGWTDMTQTGRLAGLNCYGAANSSFSAGTVAVSGSTVVTGPVFGGGVYVFGPAASQAPSVTAIDTPTGPGAGNTTVNITGTGFTGATAVFFGSVPATSFTVDSDGQITALSPASSLGTVDIRVLTGGGVSAVSPADAFTYVAVSPTVTGLGCATGLAGTWVTIAGTGLTGITAVFFGSVQASGFTVDSDTQITVNVPAGMVGQTVDVTVSNAAGTSLMSATDQFTFAVGSYPQTTWGITTPGIGWLTWPIEMSPISPIFVISPITVQPIDVIMPAPVNIVPVSPTAKSSAYAAATRRTSPFADGVPITAANSAISADTVLAPNPNANGDLHLLADWTNDGVWQRLD